MKLIAKKTISPQKNETITIFIDNSIKKKSPLAPEIKLLGKEIDLDIFKAELGEILFIPFKNRPNIIIAGLGNPQEIDSEILRNTAAKVTLLGQAKKIKNIHIIPPKLKKINEVETLKSLAEGLSLTNYSFDKYKNLKKRKTLIDKFIFYSPLSQNTKILNEIELISKNTLFCRDLINEISIKCDPQNFALKAKKIATTNKINCKIYGPKEIKSMGLDLLLAVNQGSTKPPQLVVLNYQGDKKSQKSIALVGKGITFDSGGMNLKPSGHMETMRMDMAGAATALATIKAAAELKLKKNILAVIPLTENMLSNNSYRPGDIFKAYNGKTVEIGNTDAEGRLILADALSYTDQKLKPTAIIDIATLTGACVVALGETVAAFLSTNDDFSKIITESAEKTGDKIWRFPFYKDYEDNLKSDVADLNNISSERNAGLITAAVFLKNFVTNKKWAHVDIAGTAWYSKPRGYRPKNATGYGVRLLLEIIKNF